MSFDFLVIIRFCLNVRYPVFVVSWGCGHREELLVVLIFFLIGLFPAVPVIPDVPKGK